MHCHQLNFYLYVNDIFVWRNGQGVDFFALNLLYTYRYILNLIYNVHYNYLTFKENKCKYTSLYLHQSQSCKFLKFLERKIGAMCLRANQIENENQSIAS